VKVEVKQDYRDLRKSDYPPIAEQLDAMWKGGDALEVMRVRILEVKQRFPKNDSRG
jgi:hypothetical protein